jgi:hypothetical protein
MHSAGSFTAVPIETRSSRPIAAFSIRLANSAWAGRGTRALSDDETETNNKVKLTLSAQAEKYARRDAPLEARQMAARGALPLDPVELATVLFVLANDADAGVKETARQSLERLPDHILSIVITGPSHPALLSHLARIHKENERHCETIALNNATDDGTIAWLATLPHTRVVDIISQNQERMMRTEEIVDALGANPLTGRAVIERILNFLGLEERDAAEEDDDDLDENQAESAVLEMLGEDMADVAKLLGQEN